MLAFSADHFKRQAALPARLAFSLACLVNQHVQTVVRTLGFDRTCEHEPGLGSNAFFFRVTAHSDCR
jgi:hypothetical protein